MPFFSVIIPTFNREKIISTAIDSVFNQSFKDFEILVIDNGSTDNTKKIILDKFPDKRIRYIYQSASGTPALPRNKGIKLSQGKWLCFLDSDDKWSPNKLEKIYEFICNEESLDVICHNEQMWNPLNNKINNLLRYGPDSADLYKVMFLSGNRLSTSATSVKRSFLVEKELEFNTSRDFCMVEDYHLWLMLAFYKAKFLFIDDVLGFYRVGNQNLISNRKLFCNNLENLLKFHTRHVQNFESNKERLWSKLKIRGQICTIRYSKENQIIKFLRFLSLFLRNPKGFVFNVVLYARRKIIDYLF